MAPSVSSRRRVTKSESFPPTRVRECPRRECVSGIARNNAKPNRLSSLQKSTKASRPEKANDARTIARRVGHAPFHGHSSSRDDRGKRPTSVGAKEVRTSRHASPHAFGPAPAPSRREGTRGSSDGGRAGIRLAPPRISLEPGAAHDRARGPPRGGDRAPQRHGHDGPPPGAHGLWICALFPRAQRRQLREPQRHEPKRRERGQGGGARPAVERERAAARGGGVGVCVARPAIAAGGEQDVRLQRVSLAGHHAAGRDDQVRGAEAARLGAARVRRQHICVRADGKRQDVLHERPRGDHPSRGLDGRHGRGRDHDALPGAYLRQDAERPARRRVRRAVFVPGDLQRGHLRLAHRRPRDAALGAHGDRARVPRARA